MNEAEIDLAGQESGGEVPAEEPDNRLLTKRLPPITPPPMRPSSSPPPGLSTAPSYAPSGTYRSDGQPATSWWRALLTATFPPAAPSIPVHETLVPSSARDLVLYRRIGATCAGMALGFVILALALGLRGAEPAYSPAVSAALIVSRTLMAIGFLAFGHGLLRMAERFFVRVEGEKPSRSANLG